MFPAQHSSELIQKWDLGKNLARNPEGKWKLCCTYFQSNRMEHWTGWFSVAWGYFLRGEKENLKIHYANWLFSWFKQPGWATGLTMRQVWSVVRHILVLPLIPAACIWAAINKISLLRSLRCWHTSSLATREIICSRIFGKTLKKSKGAKELKGIQEGIILHKF